MDDDWAVFHFSPGNPSGPETCSLADTIVAEWAIEVLDAHVAGARVLQTPFHGVPVGTYDLVTFIAVLHHLPLAETLRAARAAVRPGGRLVIVGMSRETRDDWRGSLISLLLNPLIGAVRHPGRAKSVPVRRPQRGDHAYGRMRTTARPPRHQSGGGVLVARSMLRQDPCSLDLHGPEGLRVEPEQLEDGRRDLCGLHG
ncbi:class I SAM-dependent methyltransferase [Lacisediminihabitans profunda]|uniref:class I SAM-dependent methyltransferase n=1 Tax=Lacisediminihabitans profunda TaxID=2594790 RepID=UPI003CCC4868